MIIARLVSLGACGYIIAPTLRQSDATTFRPEAISLGNTLSFAPPSRESGRAPLFALPLVVALFVSGAGGSRRAASERRPGAGPKLTERTDTATFALG
jgi:hypothetical protein